MLYVLYCAVLCCIVLYCIVLYCIVLYCIVLYCIVLYCSVWYCSVLYLRDFAHMAFLRRCNYDTCKTLLRWFRVENHLHLNLNLRLRGVYKEAELRRLLLGSG